MKVILRFYAISRELTQTDQLEIDVEDHARVAEVAELLFQQYPDLEKLRGVLRFAVQDEYADESQVLENFQELSIIPPVSGG